MRSHYDRGNDYFLRWEHSYLCDQLKKWSLTKNMMIYRSSDKEYVIDLVKDSYYQTTAFSLKKFKFFNEEKIKASYEHLDLRLFADCPFLLDSCSNGFWYRYTQWTWKCMFFALTYYQFKAFKNSP